MQMDPIKIDFGGHEEALALARAIADLGQRMKLLEADVGDQTEAFAKLESAAELSVSAVEKLAERSASKADVQPVAERVGAIAEQADAAIRSLQQRLDTFEASVLAARNEHAALFGVDGAGRIELEKQRNDRDAKLLADVAAIREQLAAQLVGAQKLEAIARGFNPRGKWNENTTYSRLDVVLLNGSSFVSQEDDNTEKPGRGSKKWMMLAARGASGGEVNLSSVSGTLAVAQGGTGATSSADARTNLGLGTIATQNANAVTLSGGTISGMSSVAITGDADSSGTTTGALVVGGGVGIGKKLQVGSTINAAGDITSSISTTTGAPDFFSAEASAGNTMALRYVEDALANIPADVWQLRSGGQAGKDLVFSSFDNAGYVRFGTGSGAGVQVDINTTTDTTTASTGALVVAGGVGVAKNLYVGASATFGANVSVSGSFRLIDTAWDDLRFPAQAINPPGVTASPTRNETTGLLEFSGTVDNIIAGVAQMPHSWKAGTAVEPHIHLLFPTSSSANTRWKFEHNVVPLGGDAAVTYGQYTALSTITVANPQNVKRHTYGDFASIDMTGAAESSCILWRLSRLAASDAGDNDTNATAFMELDIHYQVEKLGSDNESPI